MIHCIKKKRINDSKKKEFKNKDLNSTSIFQTQNISDIKGMPMRPREERH